VVCCQHLPADGLRLDVRNNGLRAHMPPWRNLRTKPVPKPPTFTTIDEPFRFEGDVFDLEVEGETPASLDGRFYRVGSDQPFPPKMTVT